MEVNVTQELNQVNTIAPLKNVARCMVAMEKITRRQPHLPGMAVFCGPAGWGKSMSAAFVANKYRAYYVECKSSWTKRALLEAIMCQMGIKPEGAIYKLVDQISEQLAESCRPLIIDEMDHIVKRSAVEIVRDIYESSNAPILMIGEENMPQSLVRWERLHSRVLEWGYAQPADFSDVKLLACLYCKRVKIRDDLLDAITKVAEGSVRRICVNLARAEEFALGMGLDEIGMAEWGNRTLYAGVKHIRRDS